MTILVLSPSWSVHNIEHQRISDICHHDMTRYDLVNCANYHIGVLKLFALHFDLLITYNQTHFVNQNWTNLILYCCCQESCLFNFVQLKVCCKEWASLHKNIKQIRNVKSVISMSVPPLLSLLTHKKKPHSHLEHSHSTTHSHLEHSHSSTHSHLEHSHSITHSHLEHAHSTTHSHLEHSPSTTHSHWKRNSSQFWLTDWCRGGQNPASSPRSDEQTKLEMWQQTTILWTEWTGHHTLHLSAGQEWGRLHYSTLHCSAVHCSAVHYSTESIVKCSKRL